jgi:hypothetical protein
MELIMSDTKELFACPCCDYLTLTERDKYEYCSVCCWQDDGAQHPYDYSEFNCLYLSVGQENFLKLGACDEFAISMIEKDAKSRYKKQDYSTFNPNAPKVHYNPFADFFKGKIK